LGEEASFMKQWRVDLKWVFGIPFTGILILTLMVLSLFNATGRSHATATLTAMNRPILAERDLQTELDVKAPQVAAFLMSPDFAGTVYDDTDAFDRVASTLPDKVRQLPENLPPEVSPDAAQAAEEEQENSLKSAMRTYSTPLKLLSSSAHSKTGGVLMAQVVLLIISGVPFILLSRRAGRLVSAGVSLAIASWLPLLMLWAARSGVANWVDNRQISSESRQDQVFADVMRPFTEGFFGPAVSVYRSAAILSLLMLLGAGLIAVILRQRSKKW